MKAVIPAAGFGTRFLPLTKAQPKEMLPVVNKPTIQWVVEEAVSAGITDIAIITGDNKNSIKDHFKPIKQLEGYLERTKKLKELNDIRRLNSLANIEFIIQKEPRGLGHAILCAENFVDGDSFAVLLGDTICTGTPNCTEELVNLFSERGSSIFSVERILPQETMRYGVVSGKEIEDGMMLVNSLVEKPKKEESPSLLGIQGRYVFTAQLFDYLKETKAGTGGEIQLTDAMNSLSKVQNLYSWTFKGKRYDIGTMKDWFQSHLELSIESDYSSILEEVLKKL